MTFITDRRWVYPILGFAVLLTAPCELPETFYDRRIRSVELTVFDNGDKEHAETPSYDASRIGGGQIISMSTASVSGLTSAPVSLGFIKGFANVPSRDVTDYLGTEQRDFDIWVKRGKTYSVDYYNRSQVITTVDVENTVDADYEIVEDEGESQK